MFYAIRVKLVYTVIGKAICTVVRDLYFPNARVHWVQTAFEEWSLHILGK